MTNFYASYPPAVGSTGIPTYANFAAFPNPVTAGAGAQALALDTDLLYVSNGASWVIIGGPGVPVSVGAFDSGTPSANGAHIDSDALIMQSASATVPGLVNTTTQTLAGIKTFSSAPNFSSLTASLPLQLDASKNVIASAINVASQVTGILPTANGGTGQNSTATFPTSGIVVTETATESLSNKTLDTTNTATLLDTKFTLADNGDPTKKLAFELSNINTASTSTLTVPNASGVIMLNPMTLTGDTIYAGSGGGPLRRSIGSTGDVYTVSGGIPVWAPPATSGTVTSVAMTVPTFLSVSGSPVTSSGTLAVTLSGTALPVLNGGTGTTTSTGSGNSVLSTSPVLTTPDLGTPSAATLTNATGLPIVGGTTGTLSIARGGTGQTAALAAYDALAAGVVGTPTKGDLLAYDTTSTVRLPVGSNAQVLTADSTQTSGLKWAPLTTGTVTSVALTMPAVFSVAGSPVTSSGTLAVTANGASGGVPYFDSTTTLASSALLTNNAIVLGGGAAAAPKNLALGTANQLLGMNSGATANEYKTLSGTANQVTVTHGAGTVTLATPQSIDTGAAVTFAQLTLSTGLHGVTDNSTASSGYVGEYTDAVETGSVSLTSGTVSNVTGATITLGAGTWDISANVQYVPAATTTTTLVQSWIGTATGNVTTGRDVQRNFIAMVFPSGTVLGNNTSSWALPTWRVNLSGSQQYWLKISPNFGTSTATANGGIRATRVR